MNWHRCGLPSYLAMHNRDAIPLWPPSCGRPTESPRNLARSFPCASQDRGVRESASIFQWFSSQYPLYRQQTIWDNLIAPISSTRRRPSTSARRVSAIYCKAIHRISLLAAAYKTTSCAVRHSTYPSDVSQQSKGRRRACGGSHA